MATFIEYSQYPDIESLIRGPELTPIGYLNTSPKEALKNLLPEYYVVDYLGIPIPSRSKYVNHNHGLKISPVEDGLGLVGTIEMLKKSDLFESAKHKPFSDEQGKEIVEEMKSKLNPWCRYKGPLNPSQAEKYALIFQTLGSPMTIEELVKFSTHENYYDPIPNGGLIVAEDIPGY